MSFFNFRKIFKLGSDKKKKHSTKHVKRDLNPEGLGNYEEVGDGAFGKVYKVRGEKEVTLERSNSQRPGVARGFLALASVPVFGTFF